MTIEQGAKGGDLALFKRLLREARPYWVHIGILFLLGLVSTPLTLLIPVPMKIAVDSVLGDDPLPGFIAALLPDSVVASKGSLLLFAAGMVVAVALLNRLQALASSVLKVYTGEQLVLRFRSRLFRHVQRFSLSFHAAKGTADPLYRIQYDATTIEGVAVSGVIPLFSSAVMLVAMVVVTFRLDWQLALVALAVTPFLVLAGRVYRKRLRAQWTAAKRIESSVLSVVEEVLSTLRVVKAFGQEDREEERFRRHAVQGVWAKVRASATEGVFGLLLGLTVGLGTATVLYIGVRHVQEGILSLGSLVLVMLYLAMLYRPIENIGMKIAALQNALASADRAFTLLDRAPDVAEREDARPLHRAEGAFGLRDVSFAYDPAHPVLANIDLEIPAGALVGIAGETGSGKSTLVGLFPRFHDPTAGAVLLDGVDLRDYRLEDLRRQFAIVLQDPVLFSTTIAENIAYGRPEASEAEIVRAAREANAHGFIQKLPDGYETPVGEKGMMLSGGQRQLVSLARAFLRDAPVLILDEPTSAIDVGTEEAVMEALHRLVEGRTTFMISHRLHTLQDCDLRLLIDRGRLTAQSPRELSAADTSADAKTQKTLLARSRRMMGESE